MPGPGHSARVTRIRKEEQWAADVIGATLDVPVRQHDDGSKPGMYDLEFGDAGSAAVEVVAAADADSVELWKLMNGSDDRWIVPGLRGGWMVYFTPTARARRIRAELPRFLADLERRGITQLEATSGRGGADAEVARAADLGITDASNGPTAFPGVIYLSIERSDDRVGRLVGAAGDPASAWIGDFLHEAARADVLSKLQRSGAAQRHAFVIVPTFSTVPPEVTDLLWSGESGSVPVAAPSLPPQVTHVWLAPTWNIGSGLRWTPGEGWTRFPTLNGSPPQ